MAQDFRDVDPHGEIMQTSAARFIQGVRHIKHIGAEVPLNSLGVIPEKSGDLAIRTANFWQSFGLLNAYSSLRTSTGYSQLFRRQWGFPSPASVKGAHPFQEQSAEWVKVLNKQILPAEEIDAIGAAPVVFSPRAATTLWHETTYGHNFNGAYLNPGLLVTFDGLGKRVCSQPITIEVNSCNKNPDARSNGGYAGVPVDAEGTKMRNITIIERGVGKNMLHTRESAAYMQAVGVQRGDVLWQNQQPAGSAFMDYMVEGDSFAALTDPQNYEDAPRIPGPRSGYSVVSINPRAPGAVVLDDRTMKKQAAQLADEGNGMWFHVHDICGGYTMTDRGDWVGCNPIITCHDRTGSRPKTYPVRGIHARQMVADTLNNVAALGTTPEMVYGMCGDESGLHPVQEKSPAVLVDGMSFVKATGAEDELWLYNNSFQFCKAGSRTSVRY